MNKLQTKPLFWSFLPLQRANQLLPQLGEVLFVHLHTQKTGEYEFFTIEQSQEELMVT